MKSLESKGEAKGNARKNTEETNQPAEEMRQILTYSLSNAARISFVRPTTTFGPR